LVLRHNVNCTVIADPSALALDTPPKVARGKTIHGTSMDIDLHALGCPRTEIVPIVKDAVPIQVRPEIPFTTDFQGETLETAPITGGHVLDLQYPLPQKGFPIQGG